MLYKSKPIPTNEFTVNSTDDHDWFDCILLGDFHVGHKQFLEDEAREMIDWIANRDKRRTAVIVKGDMTENVLPSSKGSPFEMAIPDPIEQIATAADILEPIKDLIIAGCDGNHSYRSQIATGHSPDKEIFDLLGITDKFLGYSGYHNIKINGPKKSCVNYTIWSEHGSKNSATIEGKVKILRSMMQTHQMADVYTMGHIHTKLAIPEYVVRKINNREEIIKVMFASCGSYLFDPEYARREGYTPGGPGVARIQLSTRRRDIHCSI